MNRINVTPGDADPHIVGWVDGSSRAVITWQSRGKIFYQELADEQAAIQLLRSIAADHELTLVSSELQGPAELAG